MIVRQTLDGNLLPAPENLDVAWPNTGYDPKIGRPWLRPTILPNLPEQWALNTDEPVIHEGLYQIDIFTPAREGRMRSERIAKALSERYKLGCRIYVPEEIPIVENGQLNESAYVKYVQVEQSGVTGSRNEADWFQLIYRVRYWAYLPN